MKGLIPRMFDFVFNYISESGDDTEFTVKVSMFEIYNEKIQDLLDPTRVNLNIKEEKNKGIYVQGLLEINVTDGY